MVAGFVVLVLGQLIGEVVTRWLGLPIPGPVIGMGLVAGGLHYSPRLRLVVEPVADRLLGVLSLLFVPAGVGVVGHLGAGSQEIFSALVALTVSTVLALVVGSLVFVRGDVVKGVNGE